MKRSILLILLSLTLLTGCMPLPPEETTIFVPPEEDFIVPTTVPTTTEEIPRQEEYSPERLFYLHSYSAGWDDLGSFYYFSQFGGKTVDVELRTRWHITGVDVAGALLFVDGYPQPYYLSDREELKYLHYYELLWSDYDELVRFTPVRGKTGEMPELVWFNINEPESSPTTLEEAVSRYSSGSKGSTGRILMCADPEPVELPEAKYAITNSKCTWERMENDGNVDWTFTVNGKSTIFLDSISADTPLEIQVECWGMEGAEFTVVVFVDNEPVEGIWEVTTMQGQKTCLTGELLLHDFDGSAVLYAMLVPRNTTDPKFNYITFCPLASSTFYLTA